MSQQALSKADSSTTSTQLQTAARWRHFHPWDVAADLVELGQSLCLVLAGTPLLVGPDLGKPFWLPPPETRIGCCHLVHSCRARCCSRCGHEMCLSRQTVNRVTGYLPCCPELFRSVASAH